MRTDDIFLELDEPYEEQMESVLGDIEGKLRSADAWKIIGVAPGQRTQEHNARLGQSMRNLGWEKNKLRFGGPSEGCYTRGESRARIQLNCDEHNNFSIDRGANF